MREIQAAKITEVIARLCIASNYELNSDILCGMEAALASEANPVAENILANLLKNAQIAKDERIPICQDTGMVTVFLEVGQEASIVGTPLEDAVNEGVRRGYEEGYLRKSVVSDPLRRVNTGDNTPAVIHTRIVPGDKITVTVAPKGFGSENMSRVIMLEPSAGVDGVIDFVVGAVKSAGSNPCPPIVVGVGIGGNMEKAALLAKTALLRDIRASHPDPYYAALEQALLEKINALGIGPQGLGGKTTALGVNIEVFPTHIAGLPVAVNISCHVARHVGEVI